MALLVGKKTRQKFLQKQYFMKQKKISGKKLYHL